MKTEMNSMEQGINNINNLDELKTAIQSRVILLRNHVDNFISNEGEKNQEAVSVIEQLKKQVKEMEKESEELKQQIEKEKVVKLIAEMPGVEKTDVKIVVENKIVDLSAEHGEKKYHVKVPVQQKVDENSAKASYKNGVLQIIFKLVEEEKPKGKTVEVE